MPYRKLLVLQLELRNDDAQSPPLGNAHILVRAETQFLPELCAAFACLLDPSRLYIGLD